MIPITCTSQHNAAMYPPYSAERLRKRRAINACIACRSSKVRCDGKQPCERCDRNDAVCQYHDAAGKNPNTIRIEKLEAEIARLQTQLNNNGPRTPTNQRLDPTEPSVRRDIVPIGELMNTRPPVSSNAVEKGIITYDDAFAWYSSFFKGCVSRKGHRMGHG